MTIEDWKKIHSKNSLSHKECLHMIPKFLAKDLSRADLEAFLEHIDECENCKEELEIQFLVEIGLEHLEDGKNFDVKEEFDELYNSAQKYLEKKRFIGWFLVSSVLFILAVLIIFLFVFILFEVL